MESKNILLIGFGNIGQRYYEGIINSKQKYKLFIFDKDKKKYLKKSKKKPIYFLKSLNEINKIRNFFLVIVATTAENRDLLLKKISIKIRNWIIEKPLCTSINQLGFIEKKFKHSNNAYINMPRENWKVYKYIKKILKNEQVVMTVTGNNWNLASNCFHFFRLFEWINNSKIKDIDVDKINSWFRSKRKKYYEAEGEINANLIDGSNCILNSCKTTDNKKTYLVKMVSPKKKIIFNEMNGNLKINKKKNYRKIPLISQEIISNLKQLTLKNKLNLPIVRNEISNQKLIVKKLTENWTKKFKKKKFKIT